MYSSPRCSTKRRDGMKFEDRLSEERVELLEDTVREFAKWFSSDEKRYWELFAIADNEEFEEKDWMY